MTDTDNTNTIDSSNDKSYFFQKRNEVLGYRLVPDAHNWTVVLVKKRGEDSKNPGEEYTQDMGYFKNLNNACLWMLNQYLVVETLKLQKEKQESTGEIASLNSIIQAFDAAQEKVAQVVIDLENRLTASGYNISPKSFTEALNNTSTTEE